MNKIYAIAMFMSIFTVQQAFAAETPADKPCEALANACLTAGFVKTESADKGIWRDCMRPIILGQSVAGITVDASLAKSCRVEKIKELKMELKELQKANLK